jgi:hypothetical protein
MKTNIITTAIIALSAIIALNWGTHPQFDNGREDNFSANRVAEDIKNISQRPTRLQTTRSVPKYATICTNDWRNREEKYKYSDTTVCKEQDSHSTHTIYTPNFRPSTKPVKKAI